MISKRTFLVAIFTMASLPATAADGDATRIDSILSDAHADAGIATTGLCDDATYFRRLSLDLIGRVPSVDELNDFLADPDRTAVVDRMLASRDHLQFWSHLWTSMLVGRGQQQGVEHEVLRSWLEKQFADEVGINQVAFELITAQGVSSLDGPVNFVVASRSDPVMRLSRTFLSVQLDCAECHDHPHDRWTNQDYLAVKRFYGPTQFREVSGGVAVSDSGPGSEVERPRFLTGRSPHTAAWRRELGWMVVQSKPFSRAMVNRTWHWLMGRGIIDPVDGLSQENPASVPELLEELAADFRSNGFQLKPLIRRICGSHAYQRAPVATESPAAEEQLRRFAARSVRPQLPEQWIASLCVVLDRPIPPPSELAVQARRLIGVDQRAAPARDPFDWTPTTQTLIGQLAGDTPAPLRKVDSLFMATLARLPTSRERQWVAGQSSQDTLFALVHGNEFTMND